MKTVHFRSGRTKKITQDEFNIIKRNVTSPGGASDLQFFSDADTGDGVFCIRLSEVEYFD